MSERGFELTTIGSRAQRIIPLGHSTVKLLHEANLSVPCYNEYILLEESLSIPCYNEYILLEESLSVPCYSEYILLEANLSIPCYNAYNAFVCVSVDQ